MITRLYHATLYSLQGIWSALKSETAFLQETLLLCLIIGYTMLSDFTATERLVLILSWVAVMIVELINSAIESICDEVTLERSNNIKAAKDYGSAAVFISILAAISIWATLLIPKWITS